MKMRPAFPSLAPKKVLAGRCTLTAEVFGSDGAILFSISTFYNFARSGIAKAYGKRGANFARIFPVKSGQTANFRAPSAVVNCAAMTAPVTHRPLRKPGRKPSKPPAGAFDRIRELAAEGRALIGIASCMGVGRDAFNGWIQRDPSLQEAIELGREDKRYALYLRLKEKADGGNVTAALAILNSEHGWRDGQADQAGGVTVNIALPDALPLKRYMAITARGRAPAIEAKEADNG